MDEVGVLRVAVLGRVRVVGPGGSFNVPEGQVSGLLAMLAGQCQCLVPTAELIAGIWGERPISSARNALQVHASALRKVLRSAAGPTNADQPLIGGRDGYTLQLEPANVDVLRSATLTGQARTALLAGRADIAASRAEQALSLWKGEPFGGVGDLPFLETARPRLEQVRLGLWETAADAALAGGDNKTALHHLQSAIDRHPYQEEAWLKIMIALYRDGRAADALAAFARASRVLGADLGLEPGSALRAAQSAVLANDASLLLDRTPGVAASPSGATRPLPTSETSFEGRVAELKTLEVLLGDPAIRLLTIVGPGGGGKTRLGVRAAQQHAQLNSCDVAFLDAATIGRPEDLLLELVRVVGAATDTTDPVAALAQTLRDRQVLVLLDNAESVLSATNELRSVLAAVTGLRMLVTSRAPLGVPGEHRFPLAGLNAAEAVELFRSRALSAVVGSTATDWPAAEVDDVCLNLDGMPLGIELAATRLRLTPLRQLAADLHRHVLDAGGPRGPVDRQQSLRATIRGTIQLLRPAERDFLAALSTFDGGFTLDAAIAVTGTPELATIDVLGTLLDLSLVVGPTASELTEPALIPRFSLLHTVRQVLVDSGGHSDARTRHADHVANVFTAGAGSEVADPYGLTIAAEIPNIRAALDQLVERDPARAVELIEALARRMRIIGRQPQVLRWCEQLLRRRDLAAAIVVRCRCVTGGAAYIMHSIDDDGRQDFFAALRDAAALDIATTATVLGSCYAADYFIEHGELTAAQEFSLNAQRLADRPGMEREQGYAIQSAVQLAAANGDLVTAISLTRSQIRVANRLGDAVMRSGAELNLTDYLVRTGQYDLALRTARRSLDIAIDHGLEFARWNATTAVARALVAKSRHVEAIGMFVSCLRWYERRQSYPTDFGWLVVSVATVSPVVAARILGATERLMVELDNSEDELWPPDTMVGGLRSELARDYPAHYRAGRDLQWTGLIVELQAFSATLTPHPPT